MPGWNEASVDELLADPIVRDLMAADGVDPGKLRTLLYRVQRTIECYAAKRGAPSALAGFAELYAREARQQPIRPGQPAFRKSRTPCGSLAIHQWCHLPRNCAAIPARCQGIEQ